jgi:hypothetical protein
VAVDLPLPVKKPVVAALFHAVASPCEVEPDQIDVAEGTLSELENVLSLKCKLDVVGANALMDVFQSVQVRDCADDLNGYAYPFIERLPGGLIV